MASVTSVGTFLDKFRDALASRAGLSGVNIYTAPVDYVSLGPESILFAFEAASSDYEYYFPPRQVDETYQVKGGIWIVKTGAGESVIKEARDRALALLEEVQDQLAVSSATTALSLAALGVDDARITSWTIEQYAIDGGRDCRVSFTVECRAKFTPA